MPPGAVKHGTMANAKLIHDTQTGVVGKLASLGCDRPGDIDRYVLTMPSGAPGRKTWKELWIVSGCNQKYPITIEFAES